MPDSGEQVVIRVVDDILAVPASAWDACAGRDNPFISHAFLSALEESGSVSAERGWLPQHLVLEGDDGAIRGCVPLYLKGHSYGEYVFDWGWAEAYERAGGRYYPKLQAAVPFTPVTGPRLLVDPVVEAGPVRAALIAGLESVTARHGVVTAHVTFPTETEWRALGEAGWLQRSGQQYHWENRGYESFESFLAALNSRKRKAIKKERREVAESGVSLRVLTGGALEPHHWDLFYRFYRNTTDRKWGASYLTRRFFSLLGERLADRVALVVAEADGQMVAGALNLIGTDTLYGRNWGCADHFKFLHFEACYYQAMEFAIERGLQTVEAGAQGEHKIQRGYLPTRTYSAHLIRDPALKRAVADFLSREDAYLAFEMEALSDASPFRRTAPSRD